MLLALLVLLQYLLRPDDVLLLATGASPARADRADFPGTAADGAGHN